MSVLDSSNIIVGNNSNNAQNLKIISNGDGTFTILRADGSQNILSCDANGVLTSHQGLITGRMVLGTAKAYNWNGLTTNTFLDFDSIPSWVKRITVILNGLSTNGTSYSRLRIGSSSGIETTGYASTSNQIGGAASSVLSSVGFDSWGDSVAASGRHGHMILTLSGSNTWVVSSMFGLDSSAFNYLVNGSKTLSGTLDRIRLTTVNGTDTFDAGSVNIMYEG